LGARKKKKIRRSHAVMGEIGGIWKELLEIKLLWLTKNLLLNSLLRLWVLKKREQFFLWTNKRLPREDGGVPYFEGGGGGEKKCFFARDQVGVKSGVLFFLSERGAQ